jgi:hypothetical protein
MYLKEMKSSNPSKFEKEKVTPKLSEFYHPTFLNFSK